MAHCWEQYLSRVHNAISLDPWETNVQLLDIFVDGSRRWLPRQSPKLERIGSMLNLGDKDRQRWKENVEDPVTAGLQMLRSGPAEAEVSTAMFRAEVMADMQASIRATPSILNSIKGKEVEGQLKLNDAKTVNCVVTGVQSHRMISDALMDLVNKRPRNEPAIWRPDILRPEFRWSKTSGQTIWVVTEILYASKIRMEDAKKEARAANGGADGTWVLTAFSNERPFPFAFKTTKLEFDGNGILKEKYTTRGSKPLTKTVNKI